MSSCKLPSHKNPRILQLTSSPRDPQMPVLIQQRPHPYSTGDMLVSPWNTLSTKGKELITL